MKVVLVAALASGCLSAARPSPPPITRTPHLGIELNKLELNNGLHVVVVTDRSQPELQVTMRYAAGAIDEPQGQAGVAHLVEHLMYEQVLGAQTIAAHLANTVHDGEVTRDATTFVARAGKDRIDELLSIEAVRAGLRCMSISAASFDGARDAVVAELRDHADALALDTAITNVLVPAGHPYRVQPAGSADVVAQLTREQACAFADAHYAPNNAVMVVSGNVTADEVSTSLQKYMMHIAKRAVVAQPSIPPVSLAGSVTLDAAVAAPTVMLAWPLPVDPTNRARVRALVATVQLYAQAQLKAPVAIRELGDLHAPIISVVATGATAEQVTAVLSRVVQSLGGAFEGEPVGELAFDRMRADGITAEMAILGGQGVRDTWFAAELLAGREPAESLADELAAVRTLRRNDTGAFAVQMLGQPQVVVLAPSGATAVPMPVAIHAVPSEPVARLAPTTRTLPNGLKVATEPGASIPAVTVDLAFPTGTETEPRADATAHALRWDMKFLADLRQFAEAGGGVHPEVAPRETHFIVHGLDTELDHLLAGIVRFVRDGTISDPALEAIRRRNYTAANGTLTISGGFDPEVATRWVDYLYGDWAKSSDTDVLTEPPRPSLLTFEVAAGFTYASAYDLDVLGTTITGEVGYRIDESTSVGLHLSGGVQTGNYAVLDSPARSLTVYPFDLGVYVFQSFLDRYYGSVFGALHVSHATDGDTTDNDKGFLLGGTFGVDVVTIDPRRDLRLGLYVTAFSELFADASYEAISLGVALRH